MKNVINMNNLKYWAALPAIGELMFPKPEFYGSTKVGERGQIVLPANLRKKMKIKPGDKLLVLGHGYMNGIMLVKSEVLDEVLSNMNERISEISSILNDKKVNGKKGK